MPRSRGLRRRNYGPRRVTKRTSFRRSNIPRQRRALPARRKRMARRRILNVTSRKKQDNMLSFSNTDGNGASQLVKAGGFNVSGSTGYAMSLFSPTARALVTAGVTNQVVDTADRTSVACYMRGYKENLRIQSNSGLPWLWRRICFTYKGPTFSRVLTTDAVPGQPFTPYIDTSIGMSRQWFNLQVNNSPNTVENWNGIIFKGARGSDWSDVMTAKVDTTRITVKSDLTRRCVSGNGNGHFSERKLWYPMNKNLVYDDDEIGAGESTSYYSTEAKAGMGDYYVVDYVVPGLGGSASDVINFTCTATLYWHEK